MMRRHWLSVDCFLPANGMQNKFNWRRVRWGISWRAHLHSSYYSVLCKTVGPINHLSIGNEVKIKQKINSYTVAMPLKWWQMHIYVGSNNNTPVAISTVYNALNNLWDWSTQHAVAPSNMRYLRLNMESRQNVQDIQQYYVASWKCYIIISSWLKYSGTSSKDHLDIKNTSPLNHFLQSQMA